LSAVEDQRKKRQVKGEELPITEDMSGELQTIPARHGVATFVPRGRTIKVINTYGQQVVSMWAFTLGPPPEDGEEGEGEGKELDEEQVKKEAEGLKKAVEEDAGKEAEASAKGEEEKADDKGSKHEEKSDGKETPSTEKQTDDSKQDAEDPPEQAPDEPEDEKNKNTDENTEEKTDEKKDSSSKPNKRTWASYLPSIPYRNKGGVNKQEAEQKPDPEQEKKQNEENTKKWSSYLPTGKSFSSYVPSVEVPDSKSVVSAFKSSHNRDPNKSYAEQLYDFSKTPVGAGTIAGESAETVCHLAPY
jgi:hypothetical protein